MAGNVKNIHEGHRKRLRNRFAENGLNGFHPHEILELILFYSIPRANTNEIAHNLINRFGSVYQIFDTVPEQLSSVKGLGAKSIEFIKIFSDLCFYYLEHESLGEKPSDIKEYVNNYFSNLNCRIFLAVLMGSDMTVKSNYTFSPEALNCHEEVVSSLTMTAIKNNARNIIIARNCGKGRIPVPHNEDYFVVRLIAESLKSLGIHTVDYIISDGSTAFSMFEEGVFSF